MSNEPETVKEMPKEEKLAGTLNTSQNKVRGEHITKGPSGTLLGVSSSISGNSMEVLENTQNSNNGKNIEPSKDLSEKYRLIALYTSDLIAFTTFDINPIYTFVSSSHKKILGYEAEDMLGKSGLEFIDEDDKKHIMPILFSYFEAKINGALTAEMVENAPKLDYRVRDKSGRWHFLRSTVDLVNNELLFISKDVTEQKKAEQMLQESEEKFKSIFDNANDGLISVDPKSRRFFNANRKMIEMLGYESEEEIKNLTVSDIHPEKDLPCILEEFEKHARGEISRSEYIPVKRKDGSIFFASISSFPITLVNKTYLSCIFIDITERKKQEEALKKSEEKFVKAFKSSPVAICITRISDGKFIEVNESLEKLSGYSHAELLEGSTIGLDLWVNSEDRKQVVETLAKTGSVHNHEYRFRVKSGNEIVVRYSAEMIDFSGERCCLSVLVDITKQKKIEESLRENEEKFRGIVENSQDVIILTNPDGRASYISPAGVSVLGYNPDDLIGKIPEIFHPDDIEKVHTTLSDALQGVSISHFEYRILTKNGEMRWVSHSWSPIFTEDHKLKFIVNVVRNITESKITEQNLKAKIEELEKYKDVTVNREVKMTELKKEINELYKRLNQKPKYPNF
jgi:PAS domain S-box-containing protein